MVFAGVIHSFFEALEIGAFDFVARKDAAAEEANAGSEDGSKDDVGHGI
jgi:hypothetical protein